MLLFFVIRVFISYLGPFLATFQPSHHIPNFQRSAFHSNFLVCSRLSQVWCNSPDSYIVSFCFSRSPEHILLFSSFCFLFTFLSFHFFSLVVKLLMCAVLTCTLLQQFVYYLSIVCFFSCAFLLLPLLIAYICYTRCHSMCIALFLRHFIFLRVVL